MVCSKVVHANNKVCTTDFLIYIICTKVYPNISGLATCRENCKWYSCLPPGAIVSLFCESIVNFAAIPLCVTSHQVFIVVSVCFVIDSVRKLLGTPLDILSRTIFHVFFKKVHKIIG
jgi:hypothetical protein